MWLDRHTYATPAYTTTLMGAMYTSAWPPAPSASQVPAVQYIAVYCSMLQYVAVCCSVYIAVCCSVVLCGAAYHSILQYVAVWCSILLHIAVCCSVYQRDFHCLATGAVRTEGRCFSKVSSLLYFVYQLTIEQSFWVNRPWSPGADVVYCGFCWNLCECTMTYSIQQSY